MKVKWLKIVLRKSIVLIPSILCSSAAMAATATKTGTWGTLFTTINTWFTTTPADILALVSFMVGIGISIGTHRLMPLVGGFGIAIAIHVGPSIYMGLTGAVL